MVSPAAAAVVAGVVRVTVFDRGRVTTADELSTVDRDKDIDDVTWSFLSSSSSTSAAAVPFVTITRHFISK